ncbi:DUF3014 domain-containing protein [Pelomicrobium sp.]|jgi:hypothetical protein|uniref:DUF3014 domain-containing protein n=1 Tax=Pelomicrobium sp. TaxID=2815319 RepID=UPI002FDEA600
MKNTIWWLALLATLAVLIGLFYPWKQEEAPQVQPPSRAQPPAPEATTEPPIRHPIERAQPEQEQNAPLPPLKESDGALRESLASLFGAKPLAELFLLTDIMRRIVATVDNLPRSRVASRLLPVKPPAGQFLATYQGERLAIGAQNHQRYAPYVRLAEAVDARKLVAAYIRFYPLFQQAYEDLGYPGKYFNDRLMEVIDHLLATPEPQEPIVLVQPHVLYQFADPKLEALSAGQKILLRMGRDNARIVKAKLQEIRQQLASEEPLR